MASSHSDDFEPHKEVHSNEKSTTFQEQILKFGNEMASDYAESKNSHDAYENCGRSFGWLNDEDMLFGKIIGLRLKQLNSNNKHAVIFVRKVRCFVEL